MAESPLIPEEDYQSQATQGSLQGKDGSGLSYKPDGVVPHRARKW
jgi:hypothetical protein